MKSLVRRAAELAGSGLGPDDSLSLSFLSAEDMADVNRDFVGHEGPTDVICFDYRESREGGLPGDFEDEEEPGQVAVDLIVCPEVALKEAAKRGLPYSRELTLYVVHGLLHAAGEDDLSPKPKRRMRARERKVLAELENEYIFSNIFPS